MLHRLAIICFAIGLALSSVTMAVTRANAAISGGVAMEIALCSDQGGATIFLDANGEPVLPHHHCPDCVAGMAVDLAHPPVVPHWVALALGLRFATGDRVGLARHVPPALARGPPALV